MLIIASLVSEQNSWFGCVAVDGRWCDLRIVFSSRRDVEIEVRICPRIDQERDFQPLNRQLRSFRLVLRDLTAVDARGTDPRKAVSREQ